MNDRFLNMLINGWQVAPIYHWSTGNLGLPTRSNDAALINTTGSGGRSRFSRTYMARAESTATAISILPPS